ncbi:hypothetical protein ACFSTA_02590 [Ornithinibacillus salinisoli]|uniref:Lipoprotein n=1 Tax=Ornithinibacillus salinisoli TaxID=1848459 RepID=A0ABW4VVJ7_9BACI
MKKRGIILSVLLAFILVGCFSEDTTKEESPSEPPKNSNDNLKPPDFQAHTEGGASGILDKYCWEDDEKTCSLEPNPPDEVLLDHQLSPMKVQPGEEISFSISATKLPQNDDILKPTQIELIQQKSQEQTEVNVNDLKMTAPFEKGRYYYTAFVRWDNSLRGEATYAFEILVQ